MDDESAGVPEWVVTYGDMMSLLLTFFIMLVSLSEVIAEEKYRAILDAVQKYTGYKTGPVAPPGKHFPLNALIQRLNKLGSFTNRDKGFQGVRIEAPDGNDVRILRTREGTSIQVGNALPFQPGNDVLSDDVKQQLAGIARNMAGKPNKIQIRGHTSPLSLPDESGDVGKMILSYKRARNVLDFLLQSGIDEQRMRITAYADLEPAHITGDQKEVKHDRVEVYIIDAFAEEFVGPPKAPD